MPMVEEIVASGRRMFLWRSYLPLGALALVLHGFQHFVYPFGSHRWDLAWELACLSISLLGLLARVATIGFAPRGTPGRNRKHPMADTLNTTGMYSIVRNPLYLGNFLIGLGVSLFLRVWWVPAMYIGVFILHYERTIFAEELFLRRKFGQIYLDWASNTPMFLPRIRQWRPPALPINWRKIIRHEHQTLFGIVMVFYFFELVGDWILGHALFADPLWNGMAAASLLAFITLRILHKFTSLLQEQEPANGEPPDAGTIDSLPDP